MWPFKRAKHNQTDMLLTDVDLAEFAPFTEADRYLLVFPVAVGCNYVLVQVYESHGNRGRLHIAHSPGITASGAGMVNFVEWIGTGIHRRDPQALALLISWPTDEFAGDSVFGDDILSRVSFEGRASGIASPSETLLMNADGTVQDVVTNDQECLYQSPGFFPEHSPEEWSRILGTAVQRFSTAEWETAANELDPDRSIRDAADQATQQEFSDLDAFFKEMGH